MEELKRLLDDTKSEAERVLLQAGMSYRSSRQTRAKTLAALGLSGSAAVVAGTASAAVASATAAVSPLAKLTGAKLALGLLAIGAATAIPLGYRAAYQSSAASVSPGVAYRQSRSGSTSAAGGPPAAPDMNGAATDRAVGVSSEGASRRSRPGARVASSAISLTQELAALDGARSMLARGNAQGALFLLDGYGRTCPHGKLEVEAELLRLEALARNGQSRDVRRGAEAFLKRHPTSVLAARARSYLDD